MNPIKFVYVSRWREVVEVEEKEGRMDLRKEGE